jgi:hypothetical protein
MYWEKEKLRNAVSTIGERCEDVKRTGEKIPGYCYVIDQLPLI